MTTSGDLSAEPAGGHGLATWADLARGAPAIADAGRRVFYRSGEGAALLSTVRGDASPRIHPINVGVVEGGLYAFLLESAKRRDLAEDVRFALHGHQDANLPTEFSIRGQARLIEPGELRGRVAAGWFFGVDDSYWLFELRIEVAILGERNSADDWPPRYSRWTAASG